MVRPAGLEPATLALEGRCSIQLSYGRSITNLVRPELFRILKLVGVEGFEPPTLCTQNRCASQAALHSEKTDQVSY